jgi:hypothetical protein
MGFSPHFYIHANFNVECACGSIMGLERIQLLTTDLLALASMKNAAKCDK